MEESSLFKSLSKGVPRTSHEGSAPSNLAQHPPAPSITTSVTPHLLFTAPKDENKAPCEHKFVLAPRSTSPPSTHLTNGPWGNTALSIGGNHLDLPVNARRSPLPSAATLETLMRRVCGLDLRSHNLASLARYLPGVSPAPACSNGTILPVVSAETEDMEDWVNLDSDDLA